MSGITAANERFLENVRAGSAHLRAVRRARDVIPFLGEYALLHAGPPVAWENMCGPMKGAVIGASIWEGWAKTPDEARALAASGKIRFDSAHHHGAIGPMSGVISPSMWVQCVRNEPFGIECYAALFMGMGKVLRHGAYDQSVIDRLNWMNTELGPLLAAAVDRAEGVDIKGLIAQAIQMGDEVHNRHRASNLLLIMALLPHMANVGSPDVVERAARFMENAQQFVLPSIMAGCKAMLAAGHGIEDCTLLTAIARNGFETGIRVSGLGDTWFTAPAPHIKGIYFPGYGPEDATPDLGDSAITETMGLGSLAMAGAPTVVQVVGGTPAMALEINLRMYQICIAEHDVFRIPALNFRGTPLGIDIRKVIENDCPPVINTGISHKAGGIGQIGAGITAVPVECFQKAVAALYEKRLASGRGNKAFLPEKDAA